MFDFSIFQNNENLLFILIYFLVAVVAVAILVFVIASILKLIKIIFKKIFQKNEDYEYAQNLEVVVPEIEKNKQERMASTHGPKMQYMNIEKSDKDNETEKDQKKNFNEKEKKDIEEGLSALKKSGKKGKEPVSARGFGEAEEEKSIFSKIKIPRAKRVMGGDAIVSVKSGAEEKKLDDYQPVSIGKTSVIQNDRLEMLKGAEIKIPKNREPLSIGENFSSEIHNKIGKTEPKTPTDSSIFAGKSEVSRIELRQKLRMDPKVWMAGKQVGLTLNPIERAKLEKEVFSQAYGRNISKTDLRGGIKKLNQKMLSAKNLAEKAKIRDKIEFFKKIGGVK